VAEYEAEKSKYDQFIQDKDVEIGTADAKAVAASILVEGLEKKVAQLGMDFDDAVSMKERCEAFYQQRIVKLTDSQRGLRVGLSELQAELTQSVMRENDEIMRVNFDHEKMANRLETILGENKDILRSSQEMDRELQESAEMVSALSQRVIDLTPKRDILRDSYGDDRRNFDHTDPDSRPPSISQKLFDSKQFSIIEKGWEERLDKEASEWADRLEEVQAQLKEEVARRESLQVWLKHWMCVCI
jgi:hypothetical protein